jgi:rhodanese-related sulfurtransferase
MVKAVSTSARNLYSRLGTELAPIVIDVRRSPGFDADDTIIVGAIRRLPAEVDHWQRELPRGRPVLVYCAHGQEVSQNAATTLRVSGIEASYLEHGISGWTELGVPRRRKLSAPSGKWVTRERPKIDRIACPRLIRRFIDPEARLRLRRFGRNSPSGYSPQPRSRPAGKSRGRVARSLRRSISKPASHARRAVGDRCRRNEEAPRFPRPAHDGLAAIPRRPWLLARAHREHALRPEALTEQHADLGENRRGSACFAATVRSTRLSPISFPLQGTGALWLNLP